MANDIKIFWSVDEISGLFEGDIEYDGGDLEREEGLETAVSMSLFTDRRASVDDELLDPQNPDRRGWWGDQTADVDGDEIGSKLWLLGRSKMTSDIPARAEGYIKDALQWMIDDGVVKKIDVETERIDYTDGSSRLYFKVILHQSDGSKKEIKYDDLWAVQTA